MQQQAVSVPLERNIHCSVTYHALLTRTEGIMQRSHKTRSPQRPCSACRGNITHGLAGTGTTTKQAILVQAYAFNVTYVLAGIPDSPLHDQGKGDRVQGSGKERGGGGGVHLLTPCACNDHQSKCNRIACGCGEHPSRAVFKAEGAIYHIPNAPHHHPGDLTTFQRRKT